MSYIEKADVQAGSITACTSETFTLNSDWLSMVVLDRGALAVAAVNATYLQQKILFGERRAILPLFRHDEIQLSGAVVVGLATGYQQIGAFTWQAQQSFYLGISRETAQVDRGLPGILYRLSPFGASGLWFAGLRAHHSHAGLHPNQPRGGRG